MRLALLAVLLLPLAAAHGGTEPHLDELVIEAHDGDGQWYFTVEGYEGKNPTIALVPGNEVNVVFTNKGSEPHNVRFAQTDSMATPLMETGKSAEITFTVPPGGLSSYWCDPHASLGMQGDIVASEDELETPGLGAAVLLLALIGMALARRH